MKLLLKNIQQIVQVEEKPVKRASGERISIIPIIDNGYIIIEEDVISDFGVMKDGLMSDIDEVIDCKGKTVLPCWCDSHTHIVFAGSREGEFVDRING